MKNYFSIITLCTEQHKDSYNIFIEEWAKNTSVNSVFIFTDFDWEIKTDKIQPINLVKQNHILGDKSRAILHVLKNMSHIKNILFLDSDCYINRDIGHVFDLEFDWLVTNCLSHSEPMSSGDISSGVIFIKNNDKSRSIAQNFVFYCKMLEDENLYQNSFPFYDEVALYYVFRDYNLSYLPYQYNNYVFDHPLSLDQSYILHFTRRIYRHINVYETINAKPQKYVDYYIRLGDTLYDLFLGDWYYIYQLNKELQKIRPNPNLIEIGDKIAWPILSDIFYEHKKLIINIIKEHIKNCFIVGSQFNDFSVFEDTNITYSETKNHWSQYIKDLYKLNNTDYMNYSDSIDLLFLNSDYRHQENEPSFNMLKDQSKFVLSFNKIVKPIDEKFKVIEYENKFYMCLLCNFEYVSEKTIESIDRSINNSFLFKKNGFIQNLPIYTN